QQQQKLEAGVVFVAVDGGDMSEVNKAESKLRRPLGGFNNASCINQAAYQRERCYSVTVKTSLVKKDGRNISEKLFQHNNIVLLQQLSSFHFNLLNLSQFTAAFFLTLL
ncbi:hypothetical protein CHARACLAT_007969, partial [Characodon lateralis]|nr:hypothetical protein [Characodon lateralis]